MGLDLTFVAGQSSHEIRLQAVDVDVLHVLSKETPDDVEAVIGAHDFGAPRPVSRARLLQATDTLLGRLEKNADSLPFVYTYKIAEGPAKDDRPGTGMVSGFRMNGDKNYFYTINSGLGFCYLLKSEATKDGMVRDVEKIDLRAQTSLQTDDWGKIKIYKKKKKLGLERHLRELKEFLLEHAVDRVTKTLG